MENENYLGTWILLLLEAAMFIQHAVHKDHALSRAAMCVEHATRKVWHPSSLLELSLLYKQTAVVKENISHAYTWQITDLFR